MNESDHIQPPTTVKEVGIHVGYLRDDIVEVKELLRHHIELAATKAELEKVITLVSDIQEREKNYVTVKQLWGTVVGVGTVITIIVTVINLVEKIRGV